MRRLSITARPPDPTGTAVTDEALQLIDLRRSFGDRAALDGLSFASRPARSSASSGRTAPGRPRRCAPSSVSSRRTAARSAGAARPSMPQARRTFGYMPEERGLYPGMIVLEQLVYLGRLYGLTRGRGPVVRASSWTERLGIADKRDLPRSRRCRKATSSACSSPPRSCTGPSCSSSTNRSRASTRWAWTT